MCFLFFVQYCCSSTITKIQDGGFTYDRQEGTSLVLLQEWAIEVLDKQGASSSNGLGLDGTAGTLAKQGASAVLLEEGAAREVRDPRLKK